MNRTARVLLGALTATVVGATLAPHASATTTDQAAWNRAVRLCAEVSDDTTYEHCVVGYAENATGRALTSDDYHADGKVLVLDHATRPLATAIAKPSKGDKALMAAANADCASVPNHSVKWAACVTGAMSERGNDTRFVTGKDWFAIKVRKHVGYTWKAYLVHAPHALAD